jgi:hypothetical protein
MFMRKPRVHLATARAVIAAKHFAVAAGFWSKAIGGMPVPPRRRGLNSMARGVHGQGAAPDRAQTGKRACSAIRAAR